MRLEEMRDKYPEAFQVCRKWWLDTPNYKNRDLFDFFDKQGIKLFIDFHDAFGYEVQTDVYYVPKSTGKYIRCEISEKYKAGNWVILFDEMDYTTRTEAEEAGFEKCFEILNERELK